MSEQRADLTFKDNVKRGRHGWVRLTPAYSVKVVHQILDHNPHLEYILEPFSGTGTTGLVAAQRGLQCDLHDINPFLIWLAHTKCAHYDDQQIAHAKTAAQAIIASAQDLQTNPQDLWIPPISHIERWWLPDRLATLAKIFHSLQDVVPNASPAKHLLLIAFCRLTMRWSNAAFNHQSMSFKKDDQLIQPRLFDESEEIYQTFWNDVQQMLKAASEPVPGTVRTYLADSRQLQAQAGGLYDAVITSPPYVNRMSYIRELRPYMFWLGYLEKASDAGELDWQAIGGTWGVATSRLNDWSPTRSLNLPHLERLIERIAQSSELLSHYVHRYFVDMDTHFDHLSRIMPAGSQLFYIVGNSKFYDTLVPAEQIYAELMRRYGFGDTNIETIRKRNSKKELYEYLVSARKSV